MFSRVHAMVQNFQKHIELKEKRKQGMIVAAKKKKQAMEMGLRWRDEIVWDIRYLSVGSPPTSGHVPFLEGIDLLFQEVAMG